MQDGSDGAFSASFGGASADGTHVFFTTTEPLVRADTDTNREDVYERAGGVTRMVSNRVDGADASFDAEFGGASADGTRVFFETTEPLLTADADTNRRDVYERAGGQTTLVSDRVQAGPDGAFSASFRGASVDGTRVFFETTEPLVDADGDTNRQDIYERAGGQTTLVSDRVQDTSDGAFDAIFGGASADGTRVFFETDEPLVDADTEGGRFDVYERSGGQTTLVSDRVQDTSDAVIHAFFGGVSADGTRVFFTTDENILAVDTDKDGVDVYERAGGVTTLVSDRVQTGPDAGSDDVDFGGASADGTRVFFETPEDLLAADTDDGSDVYERSGGQTTLVSDRVQMGADGPDGAFFGGASADGTRVFFTTGEPLVAADADADRTDLYERAGGQTTLVSDRVQDASDGAFTVFFGGVSADGTRVFFETPEALLSTDGDTAQDVYAARIPQPPETTIVAGPTGPTSDATPSFEFTASEPGSSFECRLDAGQFAPCGSPFASGTLSDGPHTFEVRTIDVEGDTDATPALRAFTVDTQGPGAPTLAGPSGPTRDATPTFTFAAEPGATLECRLDGGAFAPCLSSFTASAVGEGPHSFEVRGTDALGNVGAPASLSFTVDTRPPRLTGAGVTKKRFRLGPRPTPRVAAAPRGTAFRFRLFEVARVTIAITRPSAGRRVGRRCVAPNRSNRRRPACTRLVTVGTLTRQGRSGPNSVAFSGRIATRALTPGKYTATLIAVDAAGNRSRAARVAFTVVRR